MSGRKRKSDEEKLEKYARKIRKIEEKQELERLRQLALESKNSAKEVVSKVNENKDSTVKKDDATITTQNAISPSEGKDEEVSIMDQDELVDESVEETDENWLKIIGDDPKQSKVLQMNIREDLLSRWSFICKEGNSKEMKELFEQLDKKYECLKELHAPKLNQEIVSAIKEVAVTRDKYMVEVQESAGKAISIIGSLMTSLYEDPESMELETLLECLSDTARLLAFMIFKESKSKKAFIEPGLSKETVAILKDTKIDEFLYSNQLSEKLKGARAVNKLAESMKAQPPNKAGSSNQKQGKQALNQKFPFSRRPGQAGFTPTGGRQKQKPFFGKNKQQFINHNAQASNQRSTSQQKQDKSA